MVSFLDGDKDNCDIDNLVLIDNKENLELNRSNLRSPTSMWFAGIFPLQNIVALHFSYCSGLIFFPLWRARW